MMKKKLVITSEAFVMPGSVAIELNSPVFRGDRLLRLRKDHRMNQEEMGQVVGRSASAVSRWETGQNDPTVPELIRICQYFQIDADFLLRRR